MALTVDDRPIRPLTADDVMRMVKAGILGDDDRVELLGGVLTEKPVKSPEHAAVQARLLTWLAPALERYDLRTEAPILVPQETYLPEPDVAILRRTGVVAHPTTAVFLIEVAVTSLRTDTEVKPPLYAAAGVPEYWVVDVPGRRLWVFERPASGRYASSRVLTPPDAATPPIEVAALDLAELFAGL